MYNPSLPLFGASDEQIKEILSEFGVGSLSIEEAKKILGYLGRNPTLTEAVVWSIQGSEHSSYKSSRPFLRLLPTSGTPVILGPKEDAGIVELATIKGEQYGIVYAHESHNAPSQIVPYEGAATGVGGICRDIACMGAKVIGALDALRFGDETIASNKTIARGVVSGIAGYGNPLGVPNLHGDIFFDSSFNGFTLVNVVALGMVKTKNILHSYAPKDAAEKNYELIVVGKASDRSGFGGASFSSGVVDEKEKDKNRGAVQEPNPFLERHIFAAFEDLFQILEEKGELSSIALKDMGAGGIMCASIEIAEGADLGAEVWVENIHVGEENLPPHIILCSETQERFCFAVPPHLTPMILDHFNVKWDFPTVSPGAKASMVGKITDTGKYIVKYKGETICDAKVKDITAGLVIDRPYILPNDESIQEDEIPTIENISHFINHFIARPNLASRECITENYDQTVQGNTVLQRHQAEAGVIAPLRDEINLSAEDKKRGFAVSVAGSPHLGGVSAYAQGANAVITAIHRVACVGANARSLTDCLNYGNPEIQEDMGKFVAGITGVADAAKAITMPEFPLEPTPFISGNVSLYKRGNPSAIVSCIGTMENTEKAIGNIPKPGEVAVLLGKRHEEIGGTEFTQALQITRKAPKVDLKQANDLVHLMHVLHQKNLLVSSRVIAEGGLVSSLFTSCIVGNCGFIGEKTNLSLLQWFAEGNALLVSTNNPENILEEAAQKGVSAIILGKYTSDEKIITEIFEGNVVNLKTEWEEGLRNIMKG